jgi:phage terminase large subunit-like protein
VRREFVRAVGALEPPAQRRLLLALGEEQARRIDGHWPIWAHAGQAEPQGDWSTWVLMAGRGFGKTRAGAEWVSQFARDHPGAAIALVAATAEEARAVMIEGRSGLLAVAREEEREAVRWEPSRRRLTFASGAEAFIYSGANPEGLRGPEHHAAWCDELAKWKQAGAAWDNLRLGLRLGVRPRAIVTTTPRSVAALKRILAAARTATSGGTTWSNPHLSEAAVEELAGEHRGTRFGRQELEGVLIEDVEGALWTRETIERARVLRHGSSTGSAPAQDERSGDARVLRHGSSTGSAPAQDERSGDARVLRHGSSTGSAPAQDGRNALVRVVIGVDPPASAEGNSCGIVVCGLGEDGVGYVLADLSVAGLSPEGWASRVAAAAEAWSADRVVAEKNNGGEMVEAVLRGVDAALPVTLVHASAGKAARAEPVAQRFEKGTAKLAGRFPELEDEMCALTYGGGYAGSGSPDRADAMVWAMTELVVRAPRAEPRVRRL